MAAAAAQFRELWLANGGDDVYACWKLTYHEEFFAGGQTSAILPHPPLFLSRRLNSDEGGLPAKWQSLLHHEDFFADGESVILPPPLLFLVGVKKRR